MTFDDLRSSASSLQHKESSRDNIKAAAIIDLYKKSIELDKANTDKLSNEIIISKAAELLMTDEKLYINALSKVQSLNKSFIDNKELRCTIFSKYIIDKLDFAKTLSATEVFFNEKLTFDEFLAIIKTKKVYTYVSDDTLNLVYEMLISKSLV